MSRERQVEELLEGMASLKRVMARHMRQFSKEYSITPAQWHAMALICHHGVRSVKELAAELSISSSAATQLIDGLVERGYVERKQNVDDRRTVELTPSRESKEHCGRMKRVAVREMTRMFDALTDREFETYCSLARKMSTDARQ